MIVGLDSATPPTAAQVAAAESNGISLWNGYLQTHSGVGLYHAWGQADFTRVKALPGTPIAYVSGWDDPAAVKALAKSWGVLACLDVESGIRSNGPWVQAWLNTSGAGLYGVELVHQGRTAPFHILAWYPGYDPKKTFVDPRPASPCGWQWENSHNEFGVTVDRCWFDDWFGGDEVTDPDILNLLHDLAQMAAFGGVDQTNESREGFRVAANAGKATGTFIGWLGSAQGKAWQTKLASSGPGPKGDKGDVGPVGPKGDTGPPGDVSQIDLSAYTLIKR